MAAVGSSHDHQPLVSFKVDTIESSHLLLHVQDANTAYF
jgi:hypothetical protein